MTTRPKSGRRVSNNPTFPNRKVAPDVSIHSSAVDDHKGISAHHYKDDKLAAGIRATDQRNYVEAIKQFSLIRPETTTSLYLLGCARLELKHYTQTKEAITDFNNCYKLAAQTEKPPFALELWHKRAVAYHNMNKNDEAVKDYSEFIHRCRALGEQGKANLEKGLIDRGLAYQAMYELNMALKDMDEANRLTSFSNPYYLCCRAGVYTSRHEYEDADKDLQRAASFGCDRSAESLLQRAIVLADLGRHNAALEDLRKALTLTNDIIQQSEICYQCGLNDYALNNKDQALHWFGRAINLNSFHAQAYYELGRMQAEKEQYKDALKTLTRAHELSPEQGDVLLERAIVNQHLDKPDDVAHDRKLGKQLNLSPFSIITMLAAHIKTLRNEMDRSGVLLRHHMELAMAYDGLLSQKTHDNAKMEYYEDAVTEYRTVMETDKKYIYPQACALRALCQKKMNDLIAAHALHLEFYDILDKHKAAEYHWKIYLVDTKDKMEKGLLEPHLNDSAVSQLVHMELNRRKKIIDEETYQNDTEDRYQNQLAFYRSLRVDLSEVLAAIAVLNLDKSKIIDNANSTPDKIGKIVELLSETETSISDIESALNDNSSKVHAKVLRRADYEMIRMKLSAIGDVGHMTDQLDVVQLVARHLCTRYRSQLLCLKTKDLDADDDEVVERVSSSSSWWKCCGQGKWFSSKQSKTNNRNLVVESITTFATAYIIQAINNDSIQTSYNGRSARKDALATMLVLLISRAGAKVGEGLFSSFGHEKGSLPLDSKELFKMLEASQQPTMDEENTSPIGWNIYEFFRAPGIYYHADADQRKIRYYGSDPSMKPDTYGYRLGTREEVQVLKRSNTHEK